MAARAISSVNEHSGIGMTSARTRERLIQRLVEQGIRDPRVLDRIRNVPRHLFVDEALSSRAYEDTALPIGHGQTISQPYVVARMTEAVTLGGTPEKVLEIGTGCGYQTAVLAPLVGKLYSIERIEALLDQLAEGGRLVAPVGPEGRQELLRMTRRGDQFLRERLGFVSFVPLLGGTS